MKRKSAIKILRPALVGDADAMQRFTREAENASKLLHPNVASIFDFGETPDGMVYLAMEFIEGESLQALLEREGLLPPMLVADLIAQAASALQAAHDKGILHRDVKPDNLMVSRTDDGRYLVKLVDFGIARTVDGGATKVTRTGFAVGTPAYMSPEQLSGDTLDARSDIYSLALVAFVMMTGREAFGAVSAKDALITRLTSRPQRLADVWPDTPWPAVLQSVFDKGLAPDVSDRYSRVIDFASELADAVQVAPTVTAPMPAMSQRPIAFTPSATIAQRPRSQEIPIARPIGMPPARRGGFLPWILIVVVVVLGTYWYGSQQPSGSARQIADLLRPVLGKVYDPVKDSRARNAVPDQPATTKSRSKRKSVVPAAPSTPSVPTDTSTNNQ
jgi:serine/threonine-protein kinase